MGTSSITKHEMHFWIFETLQPRSFKTLKLWNFANLKHKTWELLNLTTSDFRNCFIFDTPNLFPSLFTKVVGCRGGNRYVEKEPLTFGELILDDSLGFPYYRLIDVGWFPSFTYYRLIHIGWCPFLKIKKFGCCLPWNK